MSSTRSFFHAPLAEVDSAIAHLVKAEHDRQTEGIEMIASENIASRAVIEATGTVLANKYAEGYPSRRYYGGCEVVDEIEALAIERAKQLFGVRHANVQPHSGSQANQTVFMALMKPGDTFMGMSLDAGGHLTHGAKPNASGKWFNAVGYGVGQQSHLVDLDQLRDTAKQVKPKLIIAGATAYPRTVDFAGFRSICDEVGAYLMVDMAHFAGLVAGGAYPSPVPYADVITTTTHKTLRCARGGMVLTNDDDLAKKINSAVFPGLQGGPLLQMIAGKAVGFWEAMQPEFSAYAHQIVANAKALANGFHAHDIAMVSGGTDTHLVLADFSPMRITGKAADAAFGRAGISTNKNNVPSDPQPPTITSGVRFGTPAITTRGMAEEECMQIAALISRVVRALETGDQATIDAAEKEVKQEVQSLAARFPLYGF